MSLVTNISTQTPKWAAQGLLILNGVYVGILALQSAGVIDILPVSQEAKDKVKSVMAAIVVIGNVLLVSQKTKAGSPDNLDQLHM